MADSYHEISMIAETQTIMNNFTHGTPIAIGAM